MDTLAKLAPVTTVGNKSWIYTTAWSVCLVLICKQRVLEKLITISDQPKGGCTECDVLKRLLLAACHSNQPCCSCHSTELGRVTKGKQPGQRPDGSTETASASQQQIAWQQIGASVSHCAQKRGFCASGRDGTPARRCVQHGHSSCGTPCSTMCACVPESVLVTDIVCSHSLQHGALCWLGHAHSAHSFQYE